MLILLSTVAPLSYIPRSPVPPELIFKFPDEFKSPFTVAATEPGPVAVVLFPRLRVPPLLNTPIPPPARKLNVRFPVVPRLAVPPSIYTPVPPFILNLLIPVVRVVPAST